MKRITAKGRFLSQPGAADYTPLEEAQMVELAAVDTDSLDAIHALKVLMPDSTILPAPGIAGARQWANAALQKETP